VPRGHVAVRNGSDYRITGSKIFITHAGVGEIFVVTAVTDRTAA
jgi:alkylation response protein AidB-like acyl-CoA dehydrogenase